MRVQAASPARGISASALCSSLGLGAIHPFQKSWPPTVHFPPRRLLWPLGCSGGWGKSEAPATQTVDSKRLPGGSGHEEGRAHSPALRPIRAVQTSGFCWRGRVNPQTGLLPEPEPNPLSAPHPTLPGVQDTQSTHVTRVCVTRGRGDTLMWPPTAVSRHTGVSGGLKGRVVTAGPGVAAGW